MFFALFFCVGLSLVSAAPLYRQQFTRTSSGFKGQMDLVSGEGTYGSDITKLEVSIEYISNSILHIQITDPDDPNNPLPGVLSSGNRPSTISTPDFNMLFSSDFGFAVIRKSDGVALFDCRLSSVPDTFQFEKQFIQLTTKLESEPIIYGLGQRRTRLALPVGKTYVIDNQDRGTPGDGSNLYGAHPVYFQRTKNGCFHAVFMATAVPMQVVLEDGKLTYQMMKGPISLYICTGPTMKDAITQYTSLVGRPALLPQWSLGVHLCRWGWKTLDEAKQVVADHQTHEMPLDVVWNDIDYMDKYRCFTTNPETYPKDDFIKWISDNHDDHLKQVLMIDPGIAVTDDTDYSIYTDLLNSGYYLRNRTDNPYHGQVWPGTVLFPDFLHTEMKDLWSKWMSSFVKEMDVDGIWLDMNEIADFCPMDGCDVDPEPIHYPFEPNEDIYDHRPPPSVTTNIGPYIYTHNLYALQESIYTRQALLSYRPHQRPFILTRSSFAGHGKYGTLWLGDNTMTYSDLQDSISGVITQGLFGMPLTGVDVGGFNPIDKQTPFSTIMMTRWTQAAVFLYPFCRTHTSADCAVAHYWFDPDSEDHTTIRRSFLHTRHHLISYFNTLMHESHISGIPLTRPLIMEFPYDVSTISLDSEAMLGSSLLVIPVMTSDEAVTVEHAYIPYARWYDFWTWKERTDIEGKDGKGITTTLDAPLETMPVFIRGGTIHPQQLQNETRYDVMKNSPVTVVIALDYTGCAEGKLTDDDGLSIDDNGNTLFTTYHFQVTSKKNATGCFHRLTVDLLPFHYNSQLTIESFAILGVPADADSITSQTNHKVTAQYNEDTAVLQLVPDGWQTESINRHIDIEWFDKT